MKNNEYLNILIKRSGYTKKDIAQAIGVSPASLSCWCSGKAVPRKRHLSALSGILGVEEAVLTGAKPVPLPNTYEEFKTLCDENGIGLFDILSLTKK